MLIQNQALPLRWVRVLSLLGSLGGSTWMFRMLIYWYSNSMGVHSPGLPQYSGLVASSMSTIDT